MFPVSLELCVHVTQDYTLVLHENTSFQVPAWFPNGCENLRMSPFPSLGLSSFYWLQNREGKMDQINFSTSMSTGTLNSVGCD